MCVKVMDCINREGICASILSCIHLTDFYVAASSIDGNRSRVVVFDLQDTGSDCCLHGEGLLPVIRRLGFLCRGRLCSSCSSDVSY